MHYYYTMNIYDRGNQTSDAIRGLMAPQPTSKTHHKYNKLSQQPTFSLQDKSKQTQEQPINIARPQTKATQKSKMINELFKRFEDIAQDIDAEVVEQLQANPYQDNEQHSNSVNSNVVSVQEYGNGEEFHPMILSNFHQNLKHNFDRAQLNKIKANCGELRALYQQIQQCFEQEKVTMDYFKDRVCFQMQEFFNGIMLQNQQHTQQRLQQLKQIIKQKQLQIKDLEQQLKVMKTLQKPKQNQCYCSQYQKRVTQLTIKMSQRADQIKRISIQNENLQEYLFDLQQRVAGIDLEVEERVKERMLAHQQQNSKISNRQYVQTIEMYRQEIQSLTNRCNRYEGMCLKESALKEKEKDLFQREKLLSYQETDLGKRSREVQQKGEKNHQRELQISNAEDNLNRRINEVRKKQIEIQEWRKSLAEDDHDQYYHQRELSHQESLRSFGGPNTKNQRDHQYRNQARSPRSQGGREQTIDHNFVGHAGHAGQVGYAGYAGHGGHPQPVQVRIPTEQSSYKSKPVPKLEFASRTPRDQYMNPRRQEELAYHAPPTFQRGSHQQFDHRHKDYDFKHKEYQPKDYQHKQYQPKDYQPKDYQHKEYQPKDHHFTPKSTYSAAYQPGSHSKPRNDRLATQHRAYPLVTSKAGERELSKNSKSSAAKSIKRNDFGLKSGVKATQQGNGQLNGLGSKLERLRQQIRKEIDAIK